MKLRSGPQNVLKMGLIATFGVGVLESKSKEQQVGGAKRLKARFY